MFVRMVVPEIHSTSAVSVREDNVSYLSRPLFHPAPSLASFSEFEIPALTISGRLRVGFPHSCLYE